MSKPSKLDEDKGIVYCNRVLLGNWYEASKLEEHRLDMFRNQMEKGDLMLARYRKMTENLNAPTVLTQSTGAIAFGDKIALLASHVSVSDSPNVDSKGLFLGGRISADDIMYSQDLRDGCSVVAHQDMAPTKKHTFVITSADYCNREHEVLKYNQEFLLVLAKSVNNKPLYIRFDPNPIPGLCGKFPLYLSEHAVSNTRWRILPVQSPNITRFEQEGKPVPTNEDIVINHCSTNLNLGVDTNMGGMGFYGKPLYVRFDPNSIPGLSGVYPLYLSEHAVSNTRWRILPVQSPNITRFEQEGKPVPVNTNIVVNHCATNINLRVDSRKWMVGFFGKNCAPLMKTCLDLHGYELPTNIWHIYSPT